MLNVLKKITQPLFNRSELARDKILRHCFPHPQQEGLSGLSEEEPPPVKSPTRRHIDQALEIVNACMREIYHCPFSCAQKGRVLNYGERPDEALFHLKAQALYTKLYHAEIVNLSFFSNPATPEYASYPQCWLQWEHNGKEYFLDPINFDCAVLIER